jgi:hypothetical protein
LISLTADTFIFLTADIDSLTWMNRTTDDCIPHILTETFHHLAFEDMKSGDAQNPNDRYQAIAIRLDSRRTGEAILLFMFFSIMHLECQQLNRDENDWSFKRAGAQREIWRDGNDVQILQRFEAETSTLRAVPSQRNGLPSPR